MNVRPGGRKPMLGSCCSVVVLVLLVHVGCMCVTTGLIRSAVRHCC